MILDLQVACKIKKGLPTKENFLLWITTTMSVFYYKNKTITIRIVDKKEMQKLNFMFCKKNKPTNVLSFPFKPPNHIKIELLGDLVICRQIVEIEAIEQKKSLESHWAHMVVHGFLHLLGYDHTSQNLAVKMESLEKKIMLFLGYPDPYLIQ
ncbi:Endoribonuclease YbeY [Candidatus Erwinia haradaeae]|uniref:Endoribonuclease YbeY n=1 Tax=Candidatus Erwinia haradaeae TaxID=1922217 RepID=A0A451D2G9_9GAMM|nr:Endoribonuclease YbeY [Candidatus Erwinia haradaeae]